MFVTVAKVADVPMNKSLCVELEDVSILLCRSGGEIYAVENRCSHQDQPLAKGRVRSGFISCPLHGMRFNLQSGEPIGTLTKVPLKTFAVQIEGENVQVQLP